MPELDQKLKNFAAQFDIDSSHFLELKKFIKEVNKDKIILAFEKDQFELFCWSFLNGYVKGWNRAIFSLVKS